MQNSRTPNALGFAAQVFLVKGLPPLKSGTSILVKNRSLKLLDKRTFFEIYFSLK
jgi:hypothetical protein